jgi:hypothetical protein
MKKLFTAMFLVAMVVLLSAPNRSFAQSGTLVVYAGGTETRTIDQIIGADTLSGGIQKHSVYQLVSLDTTYLLDATITVKSSVSIVGVPGTQGKLPCIQADLVGAAITGIFFTFNGQGTRVNLENLYLLGVAPNNANNTGAGQGVQVSADNLSLTVFNCVFDNMSQFEIAYGANGDNFYINNSKFRNGIDVASAYYVPELLRSLNGAGAWNTDTIDIKYNTLIGVAMGPVETTGLTTYMNFSHNDVILTSKGPFWSEREANLVFDNNIFYNTYAVGETHSEYAGGWDEIKPPRIPSVFYLCTLDSATGAKLLGHAIATSADTAAAEAARKIEVKNNDCFWSSGLTSWWTSWNDTATTAYDSIYTPVFMNNETAAMFSNSTAYPHLVQSGNVSTDPSFGSSIDAVLNPGSETTDGVGLLAWIKAVRGGSGSTQWYAYKRTMVPQPEPGNWVPTWPLPEATDLAYTNTALKASSTDGKPLGDPYWFNGITAVAPQPQSVPARFSLSNNYPNPFNPTTNISFTVAKSGFASLKIYNMLGQLVMTVYQGNAQASQSYSFNVHMDRFASGMYFYTLQQSSKSITKKLLLLK